MASAAAWTKAVLLCAAAFLLADVEGGGGQHHEHKQAAGDLVAKTCATVVSHFRVELAPLNTSNCESTLRLDKRSAAAKHPRGLALVAMDLVQSAIADTGAKVDSMLRSGAGLHSNHTELALRYCSLDCVTVARTVPMCRAMVQEYKPAAGHHQRAPPGDYVECEDTWAGTIGDCWYKILNLNVKNDELEVVLDGVWEAWVRTLLVEAMLGEMLSVN